MRIRPLALATLCCIAASATGADSEPWRTLPSETVLAVRVPDGQAFNRALNLTQLGQFWTSEGRIEKMWEIFRANAPESDISEIDKLAEKLQWQQGDFVRLFAGPAGIGLVGLPDAEGGEPGAVLLGWLAPEAGLADRLQQALDTHVGETEDCKREEVEIGSLSVLRYTIRRTHQEWQWEEGADGGGEMVEVEVKGEPGIMLLQRGENSNRFAIFQKKVGAEAAEALFARFISGEQPDNSLASVVEATPGLLESMPGGVPGLQVYGNLEPVWSLTNQAMDGGDEARFLDASGLKDLTTLAYGVGLDGGLLQGSGFIALPEQLTGILKLAEQPLVDNVPPAWAPSDLANYLQLGFDFVLLYDVVVEMMTAVQGAGAVDGQLEQVNQRSMMMFGTDVKGILKALGQRVHFLQYQGKDIGEILDGPGGDAQAMNKVTRMAVVLDLADGQLMQQVWQQAGGMLGMFMVPDQAHGFNGYAMNKQMNPNAPDVGLYLGQDHMVFVFGEGVKDQVLSTVAEPPAEGEGLAGADWVLRATELLPVDGWGYQLADSGTMLAGVWDIYLKAMRNELGEGQASKDIMALLPVADDWKRLLGVSASRIYRETGGLILDGFLELPLAPQ